MITTNYSDRQSPQFRVLSDNQCQEIYLASLECLQRVGILVKHPVARELLATAGARVVAERVYIPAHIIQDSLVHAPRTFTLWGREPGREIHILPNRVHFGPGPTCSYFQDPVTGERRRAQRGDAGITSRVCDALENIDYVMSLSLFDDVTPVLSPVYEFTEMITNTGKPVLAWANDPLTLSDIYKIAATIVGGEQQLQHKPIFALFTSYESPLRLAHDPLANLLWAAERHLPVISIGGPTVGLESPVTGASALVLYLATALSALSIVQLHQRGTPMLIGAIPAAMDMRTARPAYGSPEMSLFSAAAADLATFLEIPFMGTAGASESKLLDSQAAIEASLQILMSSLSGASLVHDLGFLDCADIGSVEYLVMIDEIIAMVKRMMRGIEVNRDTIMLDLIEQIGPGGHYLQEPRSVALCRKEIWVPRLMDRNAFVIWEQKGSKNMERRVRERLNGILTTHQPSPMPTEITKEILVLLEEAENRYR